MSQTLEQAEQLHREGALKKAEQAYNDVIQKEPENSRAHLSLATLHHQTENLDQAEHHYKQALSLEPENAAYHCSLGMLHMQRGNSEEAIASFRQSIALDPNILEAYELLGNLLLRKGDGEEAEKLLKVAMRINAGSASLHAKLGEACRLQHQYERAVQYYTRAIELNANLALAHLGLGRSYMAQNINAAAEQCFRNALDIEPKFLGAHLALAHSLKNQSRYKEALELMDYILEKAPNQAQAKRLKAELLLENGNATAAHHLLAQLLQEHPGNAEFRRTLVTAQLLDGEPHSAIETAKPLLDAGDVDPDLLYTAASALEKVGRDEDALSMLDKLREQQPNHVEVAKSWLLLLERVNGLKAAQSAYDQLPAALAEKTPLLSVMAQITAKNGDTEQAENLVNRLNTDDTNSDTGRHIQRLLAWQKQDFATLPELVPSVAPLPKAVFDPENPPVWPEVTEDGRSTPQIVLGLPGPVLTALARICNRSEKKIAFDRLLPKAVRHDFLSPEGGGNAVAVMTESKARIERRRYHKLLARVANSHALDLVPYHHDVIPAIRGVFPDTHIWLLAQEPEATLAQAIRDGYPGQPEGASVEQITEAIISDYDQFLDLSRQLNVSWTLMTPEMFASENHPLSEWTGTVQLEKVEDSQYFWPLLASNDHIEALRRQFPDSVEKLAELRTRLGFSS